MTYEREKMTDCSSFLHLCDKLCTDRKSVDLACSIDWSLAESVKADDSNSVDLDAGRRGHEGV